MTIVYVHLFNDRSGSPVVLSQAIACLQQSFPNKKHLLYLGSDGEGVLEDSGSIEIVKYWYKRAERFRVLKLLYFIASQVLLFRKLICDERIPNDATIYVNTLLPFGAALYGWITKKKVVYHLHEVSLSPKILNNFLCAVANKCSHKLIYVSEYHAETLGFDSAKSVVVHNSTSKLFAQCALKSEEKVLGSGEGSFAVLMLASPRDYKGIPEFISVARRLLPRKRFKFELVLNGDVEEVSAYLTRFSLPSNLNVYEACSTPQDFYKRAHVVLNLSSVSEWIETFGLTLLEGMSFGLPVIGPPIGGPVEIVRDGVDGYLIDSRDTERICEKLVAIANDKKLYQAIGHAAKEQSIKFSPDRYCTKLSKIIVSLDH